MREFDFTDSDIRKNITRKRFFLNFSIMEKPNLDLMAFGR